VTTGGVIQVTYGGLANAKISGCTLSITPYTNSNNDILWQCGTAAMPTASATISTSGAAVSNTLPAQYLPTSCHS
jgi:hypothetical protein